MDIIVVVEQIVPHLEIEIETSEKLGTSMMVVENVAWLYHSLQVAICRTSHKANRKLPSAEQLFVYLLGTYCSAFSVDLKNIMSALNPWIIQQNIPTHVWQSQNAIFLFRRCFPSSIKRRWRVSGNDFP